jgi:6,7-dimethyl-8-ribityllumazine synthase
MAGHFLIVEADFYKDLAEAQRKGAIAVLEAAGASYTVIAVPGALEIPAAIAFASNGKTAFAGYVALGCVIRGETTHYETVCNESARAIMELTIHQHLAIGNGILTVENSAQAWVRADMSKKDKGGDAARAALVMAGLRDNTLAGKGIGA